MEGTEKITPETLKKSGFKVWGEDSPNLYIIGTGFDSCYYFFNEKLLRIKRMEGGITDFKNVETVGDMRKILNENWW